MFLYILPLSDEKFYVGVTTDPKERLGRHRSKEGGCLWTKQYPPIRGYLHVFKVPYGVNPGMYEDMWVKQLMWQKGIDAVRGGTYSVPKLEEYEKASIANELKHAAFSMNRPICAPHHTLNFNPTPLPEPNKRQRVCIGSPRRLNL